MLPSAPRSLWNRPPLEDILENIDELTTNLTQNINAVQSALEAEESRALEAESTLNDAIVAVAEDVSALDTRLTTVENGLEAEITRATTAEETLTTNLSAEVSRATFVEGLHDTRLTQLEENLASEIISNGEAYDDLDGRITILETDLATEIDRATGEEQALDGRLTTAESNISTNYTTLSNATSAEVSRATAAEGVLTSAVSTINITLTGYATQFNSDAIDSVGTTLTIAGADDKVVLNLGTGPDIDTINIGTGSTTTKTIFLGDSGDSVVIPGSLTSVSTTNLEVEDKFITVNKNGLASSGFGAGITVEEDASATGYIKVSATRDAWELKPPHTDAPIITLDQSLATTDTPTFAGLETGDIDLTAGSKVKLDGTNILNLNHGSTNCAFVGQVGNTTLTGQNNVAVGNGASLGAVTTGYNNTALGRNCLTTQTTAHSCTAVGFEALKVNNNNSNTAVGSWAGTHITSASQTACLGYNAGATITTASNNTCVGSNCDVTVSSSSGNTLLGAYAKGISTATTPFDTNNNIAIGVASKPLTAPTNATTVVTAGGSSQFALFDPAGTFGAPILSTTATSASSGSVTLPAFPVGFWTVTLGAREYKIPLYAS